MFPAKKHMAYLDAHNHMEKRKELHTLTGEVFHCYDPCTESPEEYMQKLDRSLEEARSQKL